MINNMSFNENIYKIIDDFKKYVEKNIPKDNLEYYIAAEAAGNLLYVVVRYLNNTRSLSNSNIIKYFSISSLVRIMFSNLVDKKSTEVLKVYVENITQGKEHQMVETLIKEFLLSKSKDNRI